MNAIDPRGDPATSSRQLRCDWGYRTTAGLRMHCLLQLGHDGAHLDEAGRWWTTTGEGGAVTLVTPQETIR